jgi:hypothetical protein
MDKKKEALRRMKLIGLWDEAIDVFKKEGRVCYSEPANVLGHKFGAVYLLDGDMPERVKAFEEEHKALVYHVVHSYTEFGEWLTFLYVSNYEEEWAMDREDLKSGYPVAYVDTGDWNSEFGSVGIKNVGGGLLRVA